MSRTLMVSGAGGSLGRCAIETLLHDPGSRLVAGTRDPAKLADLEARGVEVRPVDFDDPATLEHAFDGVDQLLIVSTDRSDVPGLRYRRHNAALVAARAAGVAHVVYTSRLASTPTPGGAITDDHFWTEHTLVASGMGFTVLRNNLYAELVLMMLPQTLALGTITSATAGRARSYVARDDCPRTAAAALVFGKADGMILDVTGPELTTQYQLAAMLSELHGRTIRHVDLPAEALMETMRAAGVSEAKVQSRTRLETDCAQGYHALVTPVVERLTGCPPIALRSILEQARRGDPRPDGSRRMIAFNAAATTGAVQRHLRCGRRIQAFTTRCDAAYAARGSTRRACPTFPRRHAHA